MDIAEGWSRSLWAHTSSLMALMANCHRGKNERSLSPSDFNPHRERRPMGTLTVEDMLDWC